MSGWNEMGSDGSRQGGSHGGQADRDDAGRRLSILLHLFKQVHKFFLVIGGFVEHFQDIHDALVLTAET